VRVLITNNTLADRAGSELYVRDVAVALLRRGHQPVAFSTRLGDVAHELRRASVPVLDDLDQLAVAPDVIHGQHHLDAMIAMLHFPNTPAVYFCHGWLPWEEIPPAFPSLGHYVAVDDLCAERLQCEHGIAPERIRVIRNFVDLNRVTLREELPEKPRRALVFSNTAREDGYIGVVRRACADRDIQVDVIGAGVGRVEEKPELVLHEYDVVFARGRGALEAMASGAAVIVCDAWGLAGLVTPDNYATWLPLNFGFRILQRPVTSANLLGEIERYDASQARTIAQLVRRDADMEIATAAIIQLYTEVAMDRSAGPSSPGAPARAASNYLRRIAVEVKLRHQALAQRALAEAEFKTQQLRAEQVALDLARASATLAERDQELQRVAGERDQYSARAEHADAQLATTLAALDATKAILAARENQLRDEHGHDVLLRRYVGARRWFDQQAETESGIAMRSVVQRALAELFARCQIGSLVEIGCGTCAWLQNQEPGTLRYTGIDAEPAVVANVGPRFSGVDRSFATLDAVTADLPQADAILCNNWFEYLPDADVIQALRRIRDSGAAWLIASQRDATARNGGSIAGEWRPLNLQAAPFSLPAPVQRIGIDAATGTVLSAWALTP